MFAVHGQDAPAVFLRLAHHDLAGHDQNFLGGDGDVLADANDRQRRLQSRRADDGNQYNVRPRQRGEFQETFPAGKNFGRNTAAGVPARRSSDPAIRPEAE